MRIENLKISNFRNIKYKENIDDYEKFDFYDNDLIILGGANGYGKTTLFNAIELLFTGEVKHFNLDILNRGKVSKEIYANDKTKDVVLIANIYNKTKKEEIKRVFKHKDNFSRSIIYINNEKIDGDAQEVISDKIGINKEKFHIVNYISQSESLSFMTKRYKDRKETISAIIGEEFLNEEIEIVKLYIKKMKQQISSISLDYDEKIKNKKDTLINKEKEIEKIRVSDIKEYKKLFKDKDCEFDKENLDLEISYSNLIKEPKNILDFLKHYNTFINYKKNQKLTEGKNISKNEYKAYYFRHYIKLISDSKDNIRRLKLIEKVSIEKIIEEGIEKHKENIKEIMSSKTPEILKQVVNIENKEKQSLKKLNDKETSINTLQEKREELHESYKENVKDGYWLKDTCPFCKSQIEDILSHYDILSGHLREIIGVEKELLNKLEEEKKKILQEIIDAKDESINRNRNLLDLDSILSKIQNLNYENVEEFIKFIEFGDFEYKGDFNKSVALEKFDNEFSRIKEYIQEQEVSLDKDISNRRVEYDRIYEEYYNLNNPIHKQEDLENKISYINHVYYNNTRNELNKIKNNIDVKERNYKILKDELEKNINKYESLRDVLESTRKNYQTEIVEAIKIPLFLFSGRIIQNYPLGLGIRTKVETNQVVFQVSNLEKNEDVYNILSTGQLNGLIISLLLTLNAVYRKDLSISTILIDDPLQTIDDISAISFVELLIQQFSDIQIIISTHEIEKERLLMYKYIQAGKKVEKINMMERYLEQFA